MRACLLQRAVLFSLVVGVRSDCYSRNGDTYQSRFFENEQLISCGNGTNNCCLQGDKCGSNLLCTQGGGIGRQYCAVKDWSSGCSALFPEVADLGLGLVDCGENVFCYGSDDCCAVQGGKADLRYVNPLTGEVKDAESKDADATKTPTWWKVDSVGVLASMRTASASQTVGTSEATTSASAQSTHASSDSVSTASTPTSLSTATPTGAGNETNQSSGGGISAGAGAGIGIGATAALTIIALLAWLFLRERKKRKALQGKGYTQEAAMNTTMHQPQAAWKGTEYYAHEAPPNSRLELEQERARYEMDHGRARPELP